MPALYLFGRKTVVGGDDLHVPCLLAIAFRLLQLILFLNPIWLYIWIAYLRKRNPNPDDLGGDDNEENEDEEDEDRWLLASSMSTTMAMTGGFHSVGDNVVFTDSSSYHLSSSCRSFYAPTSARQIRRIRLSWEIVLFLYAIASTILVLLQFALEIRLYRISSMGSPTQIEPRSGLVRRLLTWKFRPLWNAQNLLVVVGIAVVALHVVLVVQQRQYDACHPNRDHGNQDEQFVDGRTYLQSSEGMANASAATATSAYRYTPPWNATENGMIRGGTTIDEDGTGSTGSIMSLEDDHSFSLGASQQNPDDDFWYAITAWMYEDLDDTVQEWWYPYRNLWWIGFGLLLLSQVVEVLLLMFLMARLLRKRPFAVRSHYHNRNVATNGTPPRHYPPGYYSNGERLDDQTTTTSEELWAQRCVSICECLGKWSCFLFGGREIMTSSRSLSIPGEEGGAGGREFPPTSSSAAAAGAAVMDASHFSDVALALADYFETGGVSLELVASDIVTGLMVLQKIQRLRKLQTRRDVLMQKANSTEEGSVGSSSRSILMNSAGGVGVGVGAGAGANGANPPATPVPGAPSTLDVPGNSRQRFVRSNNSFSDSRLMDLDKATTTTATTTTRTTQMIGRGDADAVTSSDHGGPAAAPNTTTSLQTNTTTITGTGTRRRKTSSFYVLHRRDSVPAATRSHRIRRQSHESAEGAVATSYTGQHHRDRDSPADSEAPPAAPYYENKARKVLSRQNPYDVATLEEAAWFSKYQLAVYTWPLYLYQYPITGIPKLMSKSALTAASMTASSTTRLCCLCIGFCCGVCNPRTSTTTASTTTAGVAGASIPQAPQPNEIRDNSGRGAGAGGEGDHDSLLGIGSFDFLDDPYHHHPIVIGDNICGTHRSALLLQAGMDLDDSDLIYAQLRSGFSEVPYAILVDHKYKSVVLAIRGTFSLEDLVTDVRMSPESLEELGREFGFDGTEQYVHGGVMSCARIVYRDLQRHKLLDQLLLSTAPPLPPGATASSVNGAAAFTANPIPPRYPGYTLRLVGHSLGAATSTLISFMLRPKFPTLRCLNYAPPGATLTMRLALECQEWCTAYVLDSDLVPRLSLDAMDDLRDEVLELLARVKVPKIEVARRFARSGLIPCGAPRGSSSVMATVGGCVSCESSNPEQMEDEELLGRAQEHLEDILSEILYDPGEAEAAIEAGSPSPEAPLDRHLPRENSDYHRRLAHFQAVQEERRSSRGNLRNIKLFPPGRIVHYMKTGQERTCRHAAAKCLTCCTTNWGSIYTPLWIHNDDLPEIVVSPTMGTDHFPNRLCMTTEMVAEEYGIDTNQTTMTSTSNMMMTTTTTLAAGGGEAPSGQDRRMDAV